LLAIALVRSIAQSIYFLAEYTIYKNHERWIR